MFEECIGQFRLQAKQWKSRHWHWGPINLTIMTLLTTSTTLATAPSGKKGIWSWQGDELVARLGAVEWDRVASGAVVIAGRSGDETNGEGSGAACFWIMAMISKPNWSAPDQPVSLLISWTDKILRWCAQSTIRSRVALVMMSEGPRSRREVHPWTTVVFISCQSSNASISKKSCLQCVYCGRRDRWGALIGLAMESEV